jgi:hypothetical protein
MSVAGLFVEFRQHAKSASSASAILSNVFPMMQSADAQRHAPGASRRLDWRKKAPQPARWTDPADVGDGVRSPNPLAPGFYSFDEAGLG